MNQSTQLLERMQRLLRPADQAFLLEKQAELHLTYSQTQLLLEEASDLRLWQEKTLEAFWPAPSRMKGLHDKGASRFAVSYVQKQIGLLRSEPTDYSTFIPPQLKISKEKAVIDTDSGTTLIGRCPCPPEAEILRCCNLRTLDAVQQCTFGCSYCSIQSFYCQNEVKFIGNLRERLDNLEIPAGSWHFGTGQSSDSLLFGDTYGTLSALKAFAEKHPDMVIELKTKSSRTDWLDTLKLPGNIIATWSLNAPTIIAKEELLTADLEARLSSARKASDHGMLVGFHFHPMVWFKGWEDEYADAVRKVTSLFRPEEVITISIGTLTFPKPVIQRLRTSERESRILQMELTPIAGKFSYPLATKQMMFSHLFNCFPEEWHQKVFFYLCMEDPTLWQPCLGRSYTCNADFEQDMRRNYISKIASLHQTPEVPLPLPGIFRWTSSKGHFPRA